MASRYGYTEIYEMWTAGREWSFNLGVLKEANNSPQPAGYYMMYPIL
jgi:hypothetical protein